MEGYNGIQVLHTLPHPPPTTLYASAGFNIFVTRLTQSELLMAMEGINILSLNNIGFHFTF
uniref:Uncharacterized protein n=1 Tax=Anguilla anguilla TaxID=7936 RepID=A0A0E9SS49_ANGAN